MLSGLILQLDTQDNPRQQTNANLPTLQVHGQTTLQHRLLNTMKVSTSLCVYNCKALIVLSSSNGYLL